MTTKVAKPKLDITASLGLLDEDPNPRMLMELYQEVGFPFTAKAVTGGKAETGDRIIWPIGTEATCSSIYDKNGYFWSDLPSPINNNGVVLNPYIARWILLGHK